MATSTIGNLGNLITFKISTNKVLTFKNLKKTVSGRWSTHDIIKSKPKQEFLGADVQSLSLDIVVFAQKNVKPRTVIKKIENAVEKGKAYTFVLGGKKIGSNKWIIKSVSETYDVIYNKGEIVQASLSLTLEEYV